MKPGYKQTEPGMILENWEVKTLGKFVALRRGHDLTERERRKGEVPVMGSAGPNGFHDTALVRGPGLVVGRSGASFGQAHYCANDFWPHNTALYVTDFLGNDPLFSFYFLKSIDFSRHNSGGAQQSLNRNFIAPILVAVPERHEQEIIAAALSDADALIESLEQVIAKKRHLKQGAMQELLTGRRRLTGFEVKRGYKQTEVGVIPEDWGVVRACDACSRIQDGTHFSPRVGGNDYFYVTSRNIRFGYLDISTANRIDRAQHLAIYRRCDVQKGDLLLTKDGANTGNAALNTLDDEFSLLSSVAFLRFHDSKYCAAYFLQQVLTSRGQRQIKDAMAGNAITRLTLTKINNLTFPAPSTKTEQVAIATILSDMDTEIIALEGELTKSRQLKQGMMQELLTGRTRLV